MHSVCVASWCCRPSLDSSEASTSPQRKPQGALSNLIIHPSAWHFKVPLMGIHNSLLQEASWGSAALLPHLAHPAKSGYCLRPPGREFSIPRFPESMDIAPPGLRILSEKMTHSLITFPKTPAAALPASTLCVLPALPPKWKQKAPQGTRATRKKGTTVAS